MVKYIQVALVLLAVIVLACDKKQEELDQLIKWAVQTDDTLYLSEDLILVNIYKDQISHYDDFKNSMDTIKLVEDLGSLYVKYMGPWGPDGCFVWSEEEFIKFNQVNAFRHYESIHSQVSNLYMGNVDSILSRTFNRVSEFSSYSIQGKYHLYFMPQEMEGFDMGGCDINTMQVNLSNQNLDIDEVQRLFPHELNHQIYEVSSENDPNYGTVLWGIIDEGFATYFEKIFNSSDELASLQFNEEDYQWCLENESEIYAPG